MDRSVVRRGRTLIGSPRGGGRASQRCLLRVGWSETGATDAIGVVTCSGSTIIRKESTLIGGPRRGGRTSQRGLCRVGWNKMGARNAIDVVSRCGGTGRTLADASRGQSSGQVGSTRTSRSRGGLMGLPGVGRGETGARHVSIIIWGCGTCLGISCSLSDASVSRQLGVGRLCTGGGRRDLTWLCNVMRCETGAMSAIAVTCCCSATTPGLADAGRGQLSRVGSRRTSRGQVGRLWVGGGWRSPVGVTTVGWTATRAWVEGVMVVVGSSRSSTIGLTSRIGIGWWRWVRWRGRTSWTRGRRRTITTLAIALTATEEEAVEGRSSSSYYEESGCQCWHVEGVGRKEVACPKALNKQGSGPRSW